MSPYRSGPMIAARASLKIPLPDGITLTGQRNHCPYCLRRWPRSIGSCHPISTWNPIVSRMLTIRRCPPRVLSAFSSRQSQIVPIDESITTKEKQNINKWEIDIYVQCKNFATYRKKSRDRWSMVDSVYLYSWLEQGIQYPEEGAFRLLIDDAVKLWRTKYMLV